MSHVRTCIDVNHVKSHITRVAFNASDVAHRKAFKEYMETGRWGQLQFLVEDNFTCVPDMIKHKLLNFYLGADRKLSK